MRWAYSVYLVGELLTLQRELAKKCYMILLTPQRRWENTKAGFGLSPYFPVRPALTKFPQCKSTVTHQITFWLSFQNGAHISSCWNATLDPNANATASADHAISKRAGCNCRQCDRWANYLSPNIAQRGASKSTLAAICKRSVSRINAADTTSAHSRPNSCFLMKVPTTVGRICTLAQWAHKADRAIDTDATRRTVAICCAAVAATTLTRKRCRQSVVASFSGAVVLCVIRASIRRRSIFANDPYKI